eukprot:1478882-Rhodomonas_salina.1
MENTRPSAPNVRDTVGRVSHVVVQQLESVPRGAGSIGQSNLERRMRPITRHAERGVNTLLQCGTVGLAPAGSYCGRCLSASQGAGSFAAAPGAAGMAAGAVALAGAGAMGPVVAGGLVVGGGMAGSALQDGVRSGVHHISRSSSQRGRGNVNLAVNHMGREHGDINSAGHRTSTRNHSIVPENNSTVLDQPTVGHRTGMRTGSILPENNSVILQSPEPRVDDRKSRKGECVTSIYG